MNFIKVEKPALQNTLVKQQQQQKKKPRPGKNNMQIIYLIKNLYSEYIFLKNPYK